jgi:hypothetical protein
MTFLRGGDDSDVPDFQGWLLREFAVQFTQPEVQRLLVDIVQAPTGASPLPVGDTTSRPRFDVVVETWLADVDKFRHIFEAPEVLGALSDRVTERRVYEVEEILEFDRTGQPGFATTAPPFKLISRMRFHQDLPDSAARRSWDIHAEFAHRVHVGASKYVRNWVQQALGDDDSDTRGVVETQFPDEQAFIEGFADSQRGLEEIIHDGQFFVANSDRLLVHEVDPFNARHLASSVLG